MNSETGSRFELWSDLPTAMGLSRYQVSTLGRIQNKETGNVLNPSGKEGYKRTGLVHDNGKLK